MRYTWLAALALLGAAPAAAQSAGELRAQLEETKAMLAQGEAAGMDASVLSTLRETLAMLEETIREMEAEEGAASPAPAAEEPLNAPYPVKPNLAATEACAGFTEQNYRSRALAAGSDVQLDTMCAQAFEYYAMYKRAIAQGYSEADANRTYDAHSKSALVANDFYANNRAD
ncbi:hypothetical protein ACLBKU_00750 [Erythrobacter sp. NE805]|uniref:hypothetical protein n=1 Tax=Erythrobacter sp. NE805 TaxID=3389875 RepID=UPI00396B0343